MFCVVYADLVRAVQHPKHTLSVYNTQGQNCIRSWPKMNYIYCFLKDHNVYFFCEGGIQEREKSINQSDKRLNQSIKNDTHGIILTSRLPTQKSQKRECLEYWSQHPITLLLYDKACQGHLEILLRASLVFFLILFWNTVVV